QAAHASQRAEGDVDHLLGALAGAVGWVHALEQVAGPEGGGEGVLDLVRDEPEVLAALARGRHRANVSAATRVRKRTAAQELQVCRAAGHELLTVCARVHSSAPRQVPAKARPRAAGTALAHGKRIVSKPGG